MKFFRIFSWAAFLALILCGTAQAHFGMVIPDSSVIMGFREAPLALTLSFSHPMAMKGLPLEKPKAFKMFFNGRAVNGHEDIIPDMLRPAKVLDQAAWTVNCPMTVMRPGVYSFFMETRPYWEKTEERFIIHLVKTCVGAFGTEEGWDEPLGLRTEIVPLTRPFGNYAGNLFQGMVLLDGQAVPGAMVEVEYYNRDLEREAPNDYLITQVVKADSQGIFSYAVPFAGWWGFAALHILPEKMEYRGNTGEVELGAVIWVEFSEPVKRK
ncbi:MAG: DUF4198 domain-containing protein [Desulfovibrionaceae bacterium]|nr:DUF4198 domain-containing protein [Desulfovibrionaceae bacterium]